jgi:hypothetical protein
MEKMQELQRWQNGLIRAKGAMESLQRLSRLSVDPVEKLLFEEEANALARAVRKIEKKIRELNENGKM